MYYIMRKSYYVMQKLLRYAKNVLRYAEIITLCGVTPCTPNLEVNKIMYHQEDPVFSYKRANVLTRLIDCSSTTSSVDLPSHCKYCPHPFSEAPVIRQFMMIKRDRNTTVRAIFA